MTDEYYRNIDLVNHFPLGKNGVESLRLGKIDYTPFTDAFKMHPNTKRTDYVTSNRMTNLTWLVSPSLATFIEQYNLPEHQIFDAWIQFRAKRYNYKIMYFCYENLEVIDFEKSSSFTTEGSVIKKAHEKIEISTEEDYNDQLSKLPSKRHLKAKKLYFNEKIGLDIVKLISPIIGLFISERLKSAIENAKFTGIGFNPVSNPIEQRLVWADTGLPVEN
ncbi:MAG: hypothetical protein R2798_10735 [Chitinophagales bacterium]